MIDIVSYILGYESGKNNGSTAVEITGSINCADDGQGNITITEEA